MLKIIFGMLMGVFSILQTLPAFAEEYIQGKLFPVENICKSARIDFDRVDGYVVIAEFQDFRCPGLENNAWKFKRLESGDTICSIPYFAQLTGYGVTPFSLMDYQVSNEFFVASCPQFDNWGNPVSVNAVTLTLKAAPTVASSWAIPGGYVATERISGGESLHLIEPISKLIYFSCATVSLIPGFVQVGDFFYRSECDPDNIGAVHGAKLIAPKNETLDFYSRGEIPSASIANYITTELYLDANDLMVSKIKRASNNSELFCIVEGTFLPFGYYVVEKKYTSKCADPRNQGNSFANTNIIKKIGDDEEVICKYRTYANYFLYWSGEPAIFTPEVVKIPVGYVLVSEDYSDLCHSDLGDVGPNRYILKKII